MLPDVSSRRHSNSSPRTAKSSRAAAAIPINKHARRVGKKNKKGKKAKKRKKSKKNKKAASPLLEKHRFTMQKARMEEAYRQQLGLPKSRLRIPSETDPEAVHREFYVKYIEVKKMEEDIREGYVVRVEPRPAVQLDNLDPELLTGRSLTEKEALRVKKKQSRRAGPRSSSWPSSMLTHDQHTEYISFTEKFRKLFDPNALKCSECDSRLWGTSIIFPLSRPATSRPSEEVVDKDALLCVGCSRLFRCVKDRREKMDMIEWIIAPNRAAAPTPDDKALKKLCRKRLVQMRSRAHEHFTELPGNFVTAKQLFDRVKHNNNNCYLVGSPMSLESNRFDSLSFDHVFPMVKDDCWSIHNLQPMAHCLNHVKANETDKEVKRWLLRFILYNR